MIFQDSIGSLSPRVKVKHLIAEPFQIHKINNLNIKTEVNKLLESVGLSTDFLDRYPHELSGGQAKRISIARAIALKPKLLIADEPTGNLDPKTSLEIMQLLLDLNKKGNTILMATHDFILIKEFPHKTLLCNNSANFKNFFFIFINSPRN